MNKYFILTGFLLACFMLAWSPNAAGEHENPDPVPTESSATSQVATAPSTQSTANMDLYTPGSSDPLSSPSVISQTNTMSEMEREARDAEVKVWKDAFELGAKIAEALAQRFETPHSENLEHWGHSQVTDTIYVDNSPPETPRGTTPPEQKSPHSPPEYLGDGIYGNVADTANSAPAPIDNTADLKGDIIKMQDTSKTGAPPLPKDINKFAEYMDSMSTSDRTKPPPPKYQQGQTQTGGNTGKAGGAQGSEFDPDFIVH